MRFEYFVLVLIIQARLNSNAAVIQNVHGIDYYDYGNHDDCHQLFGLYMCEGENRSDQMLDEYNNIFKND